MKYHFPQFNSEIIDPVITIVQESIKINNLNKTVTVQVTLETETAKIYGVELSEIPRDSEGWDTVDLEKIVMEKMKEFEVVEQ